MAPILEFKPRTPEEKTPAYSPQPFEAKSMVDILRVANLRRHLRKLDMRSSESPDGQYSVVNSIENGGSQYKLLDSQNHTGFLVEDGGPNGLLMEHLQQPGGRDGVEFVPNAPIGIDEATKVIKTIAHIQAADPVPYPSQNS